MKQPSKFSIPSKEFIESIVEYDPTSGEFYWKSSDFKRVRGSRATRVEVDSSLKRQKRKVIDFPELGKRIRLSATFCAVYLMTGIYPNKNHRIFYRDEDSLNLKWENIVQFPRESPITQEYIKKLLTYNPDSGEFKWNYTTFLKKKFLCGNTRIQGYSVIEIDGKPYQAHRLAWIYMTGEMPEYPRFQIDHINRVRDDNRWENLRLATPKENAQNRVNNPITDEVYFSTQFNKWVAVISVDGERVSLGKFDSILDAATAYQKKKDSI
jgi:hypothetical protein